MLERAGEMLERFDRETVPTLLVRIGELAQDPGTPAAVAVQLCQSADRLRQLLPKTRPPGPEPETDHTLRELLDELRRRGIDGIVKPIDAQAPEALAAQRDALAAEVVELERRIKELSADYFEAVEGRPTTRPPVALKAKPRFGPDGLLLADEDGNYRGTLVELDALVRAGRLPRNPDRPQVF